MNKSYTVEKEKFIDELGANASLLRHNKTGAKILLLKNDDDNKVFCVGFRTPPTDDTGLPHILEHSTLCGSKKFPVKEPFVELLKGSLNTFLNAMTFPDKTIYPVASCNLKDFKNLMEVYLDAVFYPNVLTEEKIFKQEGWHYELDDVDGEIKYNGVVYNEMKGAFSNPDQVVYRESMHALFPDTSYGVESGGDPLYIPNLSYQDFVNFHKKYYHPSNSYIILYGNLDMDERLDWMDKEYLSKFEKIDISSKIEMQKPFEKTLYDQVYYPVGENDDDENRAYFSYGVVVKDALDNDTAIAFNIIYYVLLDAPGAPLKQALIDKKVGKDVLGLYDSGVLQPVFGLICKDANINNRDLFEKTIEETLEKICNEGIDKKSLQAAINYYEFKFREANFGRYPKGLIYAMNSLETWLYDDSEPFVRLETNNVFMKLKELVNTDYFEKLIRDYVLNNPHKAIVSAIPSKTLASQRDEELKNKLASYKESLTKEEIEKLIDDTKALKDYQSAPSTKEELDTIPLLTRDDVEDKIEPLINEELIIANTKVLKHKTFTNGIGYLNLSFNTKNVPERLIPYIGLLANVLGLVDTTYHTYQDLSKEINIHTGGIEASTLCLNLPNNDVYPAFTFDAKVLYDKVSIAVDFIKEIIKDTKLDSEKRLYEIICEQKSRKEMMLMGSGHIASITRALSYIKPANYYNELLKGISQYDLLCDLEKNFDTKKSELINNLKELTHLIFRRENLIINYTATDEGFSILEGIIPMFVGELYDDKVAKEEFKFTKNIKNEGFKTPSQIQFVARVGNFASIGKYTGAFKVFKMALSYDYLWLNVRIKGGAYGCMCDFDRNGNIFFVSYRDPNLKETMNTYENVPEFIDSFNPTNDELTKYIIGAIGEMDSPLHPSEKGYRSFTAFIQGITEKTLHKERKEVLNVTLEDIKALKPYIIEALNQNALCVLGGTNKIMENQDIFMEVKDLFK